MFPMTNQSTISTRKMKRVQKVFLVIVLIITDRMNYLNGEQFQQLNHTSQRPYGNENDSNWEQFQQLNNTSQEPYDNENDSNGEHDDQSNHTSKKPYENYSNGEHTQQFSNYTIRTPYVSEIYLNGEQLNHTPQTPYGDLNFGNTSPFRALTTSLNNATGSTVDWDVDNHRTERGNPSNYTTHHDDQATNTESTSRMMDFCVTFYRHGKRWYQPCTGTYSPENVFGDDMLSCFNDIRHRFMLPHMINMRVLKLSPRSTKCEEEGTKEAEVCMIVFKDRAIVNTTMRMVEIRTDDSPVLTVDRTLMGTMAEDYGRYKYLPLTSPSLADCKKTADAINRTTTSGKAYFPVSHQVYLPYDEMFCMARMRPDYSSLEREHCVLTQELYSNGAMLTSTNCSYDPWISQRGFAWSECINSSARGFCLREQVDDMTHVYRSCWDIVVDPSVDRKSWRENRKRRCLSELPNNVTNSDKSQFQIIDFNDADVHLLDMGCLVYEGFTVRKTGYSEFHGVILYPQLVLNLLGIVCNTMNIVYLSHSSRRKVSFNIYLIGISAVNMILLAHIISLNVGASTYEVSPWVCEYIPLLMENLKANFLIISLALSCERCIAVCKPFLRPIWCTASRSLKVVGGCIVYSIAGGIVRASLTMPEVHTYVFFNQVARNVSDLFEETGLCPTNVSPAARRNAFYWFLGLAVPTNLIPCILIAVVNFFTYRGLRKRAQIREQLNIPVQNAQAPVNIIIRVLMANWVFCFFPSFTLMLYFIFYDFIPVPYKRDTMEIRNVILQYVETMKCSLFAVVYLGGTGFYKDWAVRAMSAIRTALGSLTLLSTLPSNNEPSTTAATSSRQGARRSRY